MTRTPPAAVWMFALAAALQAQSQPAGQTAATPTAPAKPTSPLPSSTLPPATLPPATRAELIQAQRAAKAAALRPGHINPVENAVEQFVTRGWKVWNALQTGTHGLSANIGGLAVGSQIAIGPEYVIQFGDYYQPGLIIDTYAVAAGDLSFRMQTGVDMPHLNKNREFFSGNAYRYEYTRLLYFGPGNTSVKTGITDYGQRESGFELRGGFTITRKFRAGFTGNFRAIAIGPGSDPVLRPTDAVYPVREARGIDRQTTFLAGGFFAEYDSRDQADDPHKGTFVGAHFQNINGSRRALGGFNQYDFDGQVYVPFWNRRRVMAIRAKASLTTPHSNTFVPFYLEPHLGGSDDLRGFDSFRFHDQDAVMATAEYRWTVVSPLDLVLFADTGKVYHDVDEMSLSHFMSDIGVGVRARSNSRVPFRFDVGVSREGVHLWFTLPTVF